MKRLLIALVVLGASKAQAIDPSECSIWLCLPVGFSHTTCRPAKIAMYKRMLEFKSPVPSFSSCSVAGNPTGLDVRYGMAALLAQAGADGKRIIIGPSCNFRDSGPEEPAGCVRTLRTTQIIQNGAPIGHMYIRNSGGSDYTYDRETDTFSKVVSLPEPR